MLVLSPSSGSAVNLVYDVHMSFFNYVWLFYVGAGTQLRAYDVPLYIGSSCPFHSTMEDFDFDYFPTEWAVIRVVYYPNGHCMLYVGQPSR